MGVHPLRSLVTSVLGPKCTSISVCGNVEELIRGSRLGVDMNERSARGQRICAAWRTYSVMHACVERQCVYCEK